MARVTLEVPALLRDTTEGRSPVELDAADLDDVRDAIRRKWPLLATHVYDETGTIRPHVLLLVNDGLTRGLVPGEVRLAEGDRLAIVQAVSGG